MVSTDETATKSVEDKVVNASEDPIQKLKEENRLKSADKDTPSTSDGVEDKKDGEVTKEDDDVSMSDSTTNVEEREEKENGSTTTTESNGAVEKNGNGTVKRKEEEVIELDDDSSSSAPPPKKAKTDGEQPSPVPEDPTTAKVSKESTTSTTATPTQKPVEKEKKDKEPELTSSEALLNKLEEYVGEAIEKNSNVQRKILDALLGAINVQVQREPLSVRKLILDKQLVLPNTISFPPSQVVDLLIEHDPDFPLSKVVTKIFGEERPKLSDNEKKERAYLKQHFPAPHMTKMLMDIGQDLVQEATYCDIVHAKNLPETPKNVETYKQVAAQLKPVWEALKKKNEPYKMKLFSCQVCGFRTESRVVLLNHRSMMHNDGRKFQCAMCPEIDTNENRMMNHYLDAHETIAYKQDPPLRYPCLICDEDFQFKGQRDQHMRAVCKRDFAKIRYIMAPKGKEDTSSINTWLWEKPPVDPTILAQQQSQREQQLKQQRAQQAAAVLAAQQRRQQAQMPNQAAIQAALLQQQQQLLATQRMRQAALAQRASGGATMSSASAAAAANSSPMGGVGGMLNNQNLIAAMQQHLARTAAQNAATPSRTSSSGSNASANANMAMYQRQMNAQKAVAAAQLAKASKNSNIAAAMQNMLGQMRPGASTTTPSAAITPNQQLCEICDQNVQDRDRYLTHLQLFHKQMKGKTTADMQQGAPLACSRCKERFWTYEGLERHLVMSHGLVTSDLLQKAQAKEDGGRCKLCGKQYAFNMLQHLVADHQVKLCSAEIMYSCDVCSFKCASYQKLENHLSTVHPKAGEGAAARSPVAAKSPAQNGAQKTNGEAEVVTLDD